MINETAISIARNLLPRTFRRNTRIIVSCKSTLYKSKVWSRMVGFSGLADFVHSHHNRSFSYTSLLISWAHSDSPFSRFCVYEDRKHHLSYYVTFLEL